MNLVFGMAFHFNTWSIHLKKVMDLTPLLDFQSLGIHNQPKGAYSSFGSVPKIAGGEFIVGEFKHTLPKFFSKKRPLASLINFDADLYSSTLCALNYSNKVIDEKSILIFDEFLTNKNWEEDEYKALNEFCDNFSFSYDVLAVSFYSKQVAIKLKKKEKMMSFYYQEYIILKEHDFKNRKNNKRMDRL